MRKIQWLLALAATAVLGGAALAAVPAYVTKAISDPGRPASDTMQDEERHVADVVVFSQIKPGTKVVDLMPGTGYYTRIWSKIVGPKGHVWTTLTFSSADKMNAIAADPAYGGNITVLNVPQPELKTPEPVDVVFTSRNYHDLHNKGGDPAPVNAAVFNTLKKGGLFVVVDHRALPGVISESMHRMDPEVARKEIEAAGFKFVAKSEVLARADDPKNVPIFDPSVRGKTDNFMLVFRKP